METGKIYKVEYTDKRGKQNVFYGEYMGLENDIHEALPCSVCEAETHKLGHQFNSYYADNELAYETFYIGTSCIKKCVITESTKEEMLKN